VRILLTITDGLRVGGEALLASAALLRSLARHQGHSGVIATPHPLKARALVDGVEVIGYRDMQELVELTRRLRPDVIIGSLAAGIDAMRVARRFSTPGVLWIQGYELCEPTSEEKHAWGIHAERSFPPAEQADFALGAADRVYACSRHMQRFLQDRRGVPSEVLYSSWPPDELPGVGSPIDGYVTAVCGYVHKGIDVFLHLARAFPAERFLLAGDLDTDIARPYRRALREQPNIELPGRLSTAELMRRSKIVVVPSRWPEPFGRVLVEAMASGIPALASATGGLAEILQGAPMGVAAFVDPGEWVRRLGTLLASDTLRQEYAARGRALAAPFIASLTPPRLGAVLEDLAATRRPCFDGPPLAVFEGLGGIESSALINERWRSALAQRGLSCRAYRADAYELPDVLVHHDYRTDFMRLALPDSGHAVAVRSWDFGPFPRELIERINAHYDQLWLYSRWVLDQAIASGIDPGIARHVPPGIDPEVYRPDGPSLSLPTDRSFVFLFVGGSVLRKGIDVLLAAYRRAFAPRDDVCLVIKDSTANVWFAGKTWHEEIRRMAREADGPAILHIDRHMSEADLAGLYRRADVVIIPYRAEGFVLPVLEAMGCGTPAIVPRFGPVLDYCSDETSFLVPVVRVRLPVNRPLTFGAGLQHQVPGVDFCEIRVEVLAEHMQRAYESPAGVRGRMATAGVAVAHGGFTWKHSADRIAQCLAELDGRMPPRRFAASRADAAHAYRRREQVLRLLSGSRAPTLTGTPPPGDIP
jgi:glycosyltransferase involved in cell wall biosynthesis